MILYIDTTDGISLALKRGSEVVAKKKVKAECQEAEKLLPAVEAILKKVNVKLSQIKKIEVENSGGSFTSLRIGVVTANALAYALGTQITGEFGQAKKIKIGKRILNVVEPQYSSQPKITLKKQN